MTKKELVRNTIQHKVGDHCPAYYEGTGFVNDRQMKRHGFDNMGQLYDYYDVDVVPLPMRYIGKRKENELIGEGPNFYSYGVFGEKYINKFNGLEFNDTVDTYPVDDFEDWDQLDNVHWPTIDDFDLSTLDHDLDMIGDRASIMGHWGPFQVMSFIISEADLYMAMAAEPEFTHELFDRLHKFEMEVYEAYLKAGKGRIDILRPHDDYGTQISTLFSRDMWKEYFYKNTKELTTLAHDYGCFYQQHSCGCVVSIIDLLIECGVDGLEPLQPVKGMKADDLISKFSNQIYYVGGIDTQYLLPEGNLEKIEKEVRHYVNTLGPAGYFMYPSQAWESCVAPETIDFFYKNISRKIGD